MTKVLKSAFDTDHFSEKERYDAFKESIGAIFDVSHLRIEKSEFRASVVGYLIGDAMLGRCTTSGQRFERSRAKIAQDCMDHYLVQLFLKGGTTDLAGGGTGNQDHLIIIDTSQPWAAENPDFDLLTLIIPRRVLADKLVAENIHHGQTIPLTHPLGRILADYILSLHRNIDNLTVNEANDILTPSVDLVASTLNANVKLSQQGKIDFEGLNNRTSKIMVKKLIDQSLGMQELNVNYICTQLRMSRAHVYRIFSEEGGIASYIRNRRLDIAYRRLIFSEDSISQIAFSLGFTNESTFSRMFKQFFRKTAKEAREEGYARIHQMPKEMEGRRWEKWIHSL